MSWKLIPSRRTVTALAVAALASAVALMAGAPLDAVSTTSGVFAVITATLAGVDLWRSERAWRSSPLRIERVLPHALALGVQRTLSLTLVNEGPRAWQVAVFDEVDPQLEFQGLPQAVQVPANSQARLQYAVTPRQRGAVHFGLTQVKMTTLWGCFETLRTLGHAQSLQVYPNFAAVAGYAWLAGDRRLAQIGIKTYAQRGLGTDFKQLTDYKVGDPIRHIDWKATMRHGRPIVREFQDERDQCVLFMLDCGRRMRADEGVTSADGSHFDQALNALMLMSYVALKDGDEVGAITFGTPPGQQRHFAPRKGSNTLNALMARLHDVQPDATHSDYLLAAQDLMRMQHKRALVVLLTNFRDEDSAELQPALKLLPGRHLVLVASLPERVLREVA